MIGSLLLAATMLSQPVKPDLDAFREARFGLFIHWGLYAQLGGRYQGKSMEAIGEWIQSRYRIPNAEYALLAKEFNPVRFDADEWARSAKAAGMEYVVFTTKHHEGFAMFDTKASDYDIVDATPFKRDVFGELAAACRRHGLKVGLYYSQCLDWHEFDAADVVERRGTNRGNIKPPEPGMDWGNSWDWPDASKKDIHKYLKAKVYPQLKELLTNYGDIFLIWFDTAMGLTEEETKELREYVRSLSPKTVVNSRIGFNLGDFGSMGDNQLMSGKSDFARECPITLNDTWGFKYDDHNWKSGAQVAAMLAQTVSCNANLLLNIGPRPDGAFPDASRDVLRELAAWREQTGFQIRGTKASPFSGELPWGWCTVADGNVLQFVVRNDWTNDLEVSGIRNRVKACAASYEQEGTLLRVKLAPAKDAMPRVVRVTLEGAPDVDRRMQPQNGVVKLQPSDGAVTCGKPTEGEGGFIGVDAVKMGGGTCKISRNGSFAAWHHPGDVIAWKVYFPKAGRYRVWLRTENTNHSAPWSGDRKVRFALGDVRLEKELASDRVLPSTVYARAESDLGVVEVRRPGEVEVSVTTLASRGKAPSHDLTLLTLEAAGEARPAAPQRGTWKSDRPKIRPGKVKVCMDWDDSCFTDCRLAELCRKYGAKVTFNITPREHVGHCYMQRETTERNGTTYHFKRPEGFDRGKVVSIPYLTNKDFKYCYEGVKIAAHLNFRTTDSADDLAYCRQLMEEFLEIAPGVTGQDGFGIVWSGGRKSPGIVKMAKELGFRYCRGANTYEKPGTWGRWEIPSTTYWSEPTEKFWEWYELAKKRGDVFWFWGHTQDLGYDDAIWARLEAIIKRISEDPDAEWIDIIDLPKDAGALPPNRDRRWNKAVLRATTDHADALYQPGEKMTFTLNLEGVEDAGESPFYLDWVQQRDDGTEPRGVAPFDPKKPCVFTTSIDRPGFVRYDFTVLGPDLRPIYKDVRSPWGPPPVKCECGAGVQPEKLDFPPEPKDFEAFWAKQLAELKSVPIELTLKKVEIADKAVDCYAVSVPCAGGRPVTGYMTVPKGGADAKWPIDLSFHGYGTFTQGAPKAGPKDKIDISINAHGYELGREPEYYKEFWKGVTLNERGQYGMDVKENARPETSYFRGMVLRSVRAVQWAKTLKNWDGKNLRVWGGSQGGMQCFFAGAFVDGIAELEPTVPWGADIIGKTKGRYSFPLLRLEYAPGLDYYDIVNFAKRVPATTRVTMPRAGLGDIHCPPSGQWILYRAIKAPKSITFLQNSNHGGGPGGVEANQHVTYSEGVAKDARKGGESSETGFLGDA